MQVHTWVKQNKGVYKSTDRIQFGPALPNPSLWLAVVPVILDDRPVKTISGAPTTRHSFWDYALPHLMTQIVEMHHKVTVPDDDRFVWSLPLF